jgi:hypothetical protein
MSTTETPALDALAVNFSDLGLFLDALIEIAPTLDDEQSIIMRAQLVDLADQVKGAIGTIDHRLLTLLQPGQTVTVPGAGSVSIEAKGKQTTLGAKLARALALRIADAPCDPETGEKLPPSVLAFKIADEITDVFGLDTPSTSFRSTKVKERKLKASEFRSFVDGEPKVVMVR